MASLYMCAKTVLANESRFNWASCLFKVPSTFFEYDVFFMAQEEVGAFCYTSELSFLHGAPVTFSGEWCKKSKTWAAGVFIVQFSSVTQLCLTLCDPWTAAHQPSLSISNSRSLLKLMSIESVGCSCFSILSKEIGYRTYLYIHNCPSLLTEMLFSQ